MDWSSLVNVLQAQPYVLLAVVAAAAFLVGLVVSRTGRSGDVLSAIVFFAPNLLLDLLDIVHTKKFKYYGLILALLAIETFFAFRAATVYYDVLSPKMPGPEMAVVSVMVFIAVGLCGYMVATHSGKWRFWSGRTATMLFVIVHDWAGTIWMNYARPATTTASAAVTTPDDPLKVVLTVGMCVLSILPFIMGAWAEEIRPQLETEQEEEVNSFTSAATRKIKRRAVDRVLRLASHTSIVQLVQALPADEFAEFKAFVMPIIAPGQAHNVAVEVSQVGGQATGKVATLSQPENRQNGKRQPARVAGGNLPEHRQNGGTPGGQIGGQATGKLAGENTPEHRQNDGQEPATKTAKRDAKIRQYAAAHPAMTYAKLAGHFKVSERTISRALAVGRRALVPLETPAELSVQSSNGHAPEQDRDTDELETVLVQEEELAVSQN